MRRRMTQIFPASLRNLWNTWELRVMVLFSLSLQSILILLGNKRKHCTSISLRIILWLAFVSAEGLATISLSVLSDKEGEPQDEFVEPKYVIMAFWAPFLLLHLGGPDTITAYSMEDNELWLRNFLRFGVQVVVAFYIFIRAWINADLNKLAIPIFIAGIIKIWERTWALWSGSSQQFKESLFPDPDPGPNYARYMEAHSSATYEGFKVDVEDLIESPVVDDHNNGAAEESILTSTENDTSEPDSEPDIVYIAHNFFETFKLLFAELILSFHDVLESRLSLQNGSSKQVFEVMEIELGFMYDLFYTKAAVIYSVMGTFLRFISFFCIIGVLCAFCVFEKDQYPKVDVLITYVLLVGAIILEIYSIILLLFSDWTILWLSKHKNKVTDLMIWAILSVPFRRNKRWSNCISQFNLMRFCLKANRQRCSMLRKILSVKVGLMYREAFKKRAAKFCFIRMIIGVYKSYQKYKHNDIKIVTEDLKGLIFKQFLKKIQQARKDLKYDEHKVAEEIKKICAHRGDREIESQKHTAQLGWSVKVEFDRSILLWHIATDLCDKTVDEDMGPSENRNFREASKLLSEYMLYLLVMRPSMLPNGIGEKRFQDTCAEANEFIKQRKSIKNQKQACQKLLKVSSDKVPPSKVKGDRSKSVLFDACRLAKSLQNLKDEEDWETEKMWELISGVWVEMLGYAASQCQGIHHAQQLKRGGELLTHVWLLMAHLGITQRFQISEGHGRTKLIRR